MLTSDTLGISNMHEHFSPNGDAIFASFLRSKYAGETAGCAEDMWSLETNLGGIRGPENSRFGG